MSDAPVLAAPHDAGNAGIDLSTGMVLPARRSHPNLRFGVGSMPAMDLRESDGTERTPQGHLMARKPDPRKPDTDRSDVARAPV